VDKKMDHIEPEERDLVDDIDLYYPFERNPNGPIIGLEEEKGVEELPEHKIVD
jgi:hypothetical protein